MRKRGKDGEKEKFSLVSKLEKFKNQAFSGGSKTEQGQIWIYDREKCDILKPPLLDEV